jgi:hypothetical protein
LSPNVFEKSVLQDNTKNRPVVFKGIENEIDIAMI